MIKAASTLFISNAAVTIILFVRNLMVARLISVEEFGIASTFAILFAMIETASNIALTDMIVQDRDGANPRFQGTLHSLTLIRGVVSALVMLLLIYPYAHFMGTPEIAWAYQVLALIPLVRGFMHLDVYRHQRDMRFTRFAIWQVSTAFTSLIVAILTYLITPDFRIMLWAILAHQIGLSVVSHLLASRKYILAWDSAYWRRAMKFGLPLMGNGIILFVTINGDRLVVSNTLGLEALGWFSVAFLLTQAPTAVLQNTFRSMLMPRLSTVQDNATEFRKRALAGIDLHLLAGFTLCIGTMIFGPAVLKIGFGDKYFSANDILVALGFVAALRVAQSGTAAIAISIGQTTIPMVSRFLLLFVLPIAYVVLKSGGTIMDLVLLSSIGEVLAMITSYVMLVRRSPISFRDLAPSLGVFAIGMAIAFAAFYSTILETGRVLPMIPIIALLLALVVLVGFGLPSVRKLALNKLGS